MPPPQLDPQRPTADVLRWAYRHGIFPMNDPTMGRIGWYSPDPRALLPLDGSFHVSKSLRRVVSQGRFHVRSDTCFAEVMRQCALPRNGDPLTWIGESFFEAYSDLHREGNAHSVEAWRNGRLVGGLYGVHLGAAFFGESMFSCPEAGGRDASKVCLVHLVEHLRRRGFHILDTQFRNPHLDQFGCFEISRAAYLRRLHRAVVTQIRWSWEDHDDPLSAADAGRA